MLLNLVILMPKPKTLEKTYIRKNSHNLVFFYFSKDFSFYDIVTDVDHVCERMFTYLYISKDVWVRKSVMVILVIIFLKVTSFSVMNFLIIEIFYTNERFCYG